MYVCMYVCAQKQTQTRTQTQAQAHTADRDVDPCEKRALVGEVGLGLDPHRHLAWQHTSAYVSIRQRMALILPCAAACAWSK